MRAAHSMHCSKGRQGLDTSAHLIIIRLISVRLSGALSIMWTAPVCGSLSWNMDI